MNYSIRTKALEEKLEPRIIKEVIKKKGFLTSLLRRRKEKARINKSGSFREDGDLRDEDVRDEGKHERELLKKYPPAFPNY